MPADSPPTPTPAPVNPRKKRARTISASDNEWHRIGDLADHFARTEHRRVTMSGLLVELAMKKADDVLGKKKPG